MNSTKCPLCGKEMHKVEGIAGPEPPMWRPVDAAKGTVWVCDDHGVINLGSGAE